MSAPLLSIIIPTHKRPQFLPRAGLVPFWWVNQHIAPLLDRLWPEDNETAGYFVTARKP